MKGGIADPAYLIFVGGPLAGHAARQRATYTPPASHNPHLLAPAFGASLGL